MKNLFKALFVLALSCIGEQAFAQCTGIFAVGQVCGNPSTSASGFASGTSSPIIGTQLTLPKVIGGSANTSILTLQDTSNGSPTTAAVKVQSKSGMIYAPTMNAGSLANNPWEFKTATLNVFNTGKWFWTTGTPVTTDTTYNCSTPLTIPNQPLTQDTVFNFCGTFANATGIQQYTNMLSATCYVEGALLDVNCAAFTTVARVAGSGGAGLIGVGKSEAQSGVAHGIELEANCHSNGTNCDQARASMFLVGGGNGGLANLAFQSWRSGAAANSVLHGIYLGDGAVVNPFQNTGSAVMDAAGSHVRFDYGIDFRAATVNTCAFASPGGYCVSGVGDISTGSAAASHNGTINLLGSSSGTISIKPQAAAGTFNFNLPITAGSTGQMLLSGGGGATAMTWSGCTIDTNNTLSCSSATSTAPLQSILNTTADAAGPSYWLQKNRSSGNTNSGDTIGNIAWRGFANSAQQTAANIAGSQTAASSGSNIPTKLVFATSNASGLLNQSMTLDSAGHISFIGSALPTASACAGFTLGTGSNDVAGRVTYTSATTCTINWGTTLANAPFCTVSPGSAASTVLAAASTTQLAVTFGTAQTAFAYTCIGT